MTVSDYLRYQKGLTGTKVVCAEGDCGACTVLVSRMVNGKLGSYQSINSCISFMYLLDLCHLITVEGLKKEETLHPVQKAMLDSNGAQCGYCTPGFICAMAGLTEDAKNGKFILEEKRVKNYLTGNLCRCTGYDSIIQAGCSVNAEAAPSLRVLYQDEEIEKDLKSLSGQTVCLKGAQQEFCAPATLSEALTLKSVNVDLKLTSGATDLGVLSNKGKLKLLKTLTLNHVDELYSVKEDTSSLMVGAKASLTAVEEACRTLFPAFSNYLHIFASPQIKNAGTLIGNVVNASPIADTIPFLKVAEAEIGLSSVRGERVLNLNQFFKPGYKQLDLLPDELVTHVKIPKSHAKFKLYKVSTRKDLDISTVTFAVRFELVGDIIKNISFAFGGVGPSVLRMTELEKQAIGKKFEPALFKALALNLQSMITPLSDVRGSADYRQLLCHNLMLKFCDEVTAELGLQSAGISV